MPSQIFKSIILEVGTSWNNFTTTPPVPIAPYSEPTFNGSGWQLDYTCYQPDPINQPNLWYYTIVIY